MRRLRPVRTPKHGRGGAASMTHRGKEVVAMRTRRPLNRTWIAVTGLILLPLLGGCRSGHVTGSYDRLPAPSGVYSVTGDGEIALYWDDVHDADLSGYSVYRSLHADGPYSRIGYSVDNGYLDERVSNGITYFYAVAAYDWRGRESELSYETVFDTPRPHGIVTVEDYDSLAGVDFSAYGTTQMTLPWDDPYADMYLFWAGDHYAMQSTDVMIGQDVYGTDLQDAGWVSSLGEIGWAPEGGWTTDHADEVALAQGHAYLVWTWDNHFAAFRVRELGYDYVVLDWVYQPAEGNPELDVIAGDTGGRSATLAKSPRGAGAIAKKTLGSRGQRGSVAGSAGESR